MYKSKWLLSMLMGTMLCVFAFGLAEAQDGAVASWSFDELEDINGDGVAGEVRDLSGNGNYGTLYGNAKLVDDAISGRALSLDGDGDYVKCGDSTSLDITGKITIEAWIKPDTTAYSDAIVNKGWGVWWNGFPGYELRVNLGYLEVTISDGTPDALGNPECPFTETTKWSHVVSVFDGDYLRLYVNGEAKAAKDTTKTSIGVNSEPLLIGDSGLGQYFDGTIDEVTIYNRALGPAEIMARYVVVPMIGKVAQGPKGPKGDKGDQGIPGIYQPEIIDDLLDMIYDVDDAQGAHIHPRGEAKGWVPYGTVLPLPEE